STRMSPAGNGQIVYDESGTLVSSIFYEIEGFDSRILPYAGQDKSWFVIEPQPTSDALAATNEFYVYGNVIGYLGDEKVIHECPADVSHVTNHWYGGYEVDLFGGPRTPGFVEGLEGPF